MPPLGTHQQRFELYAHAEFRLCGDFRRSIPGWGNQFDRMLLRDKDGVN